MVSFYFADFLVVVVVVVVDMVNIVVFVLFPFWRLPFVMLLFSRVFFLRVLQYYYDWWPP